MTPFAWLALMLGIALIGWIIHTSEALTAIAKSVLSPLGTVLGVVTLPLMIFIASDELVQWTIALPAVNAINVQQAAYSRYLDDFSAGATDEQLDEDSQDLTQKTATVQRLGGIVEELTGASHEP